MTDFGLSHKLEKNMNSGCYDEFYSVVDMRPQPFWWCAPEVLTRMLNREALILTKKSDVYMLGCTLAEVMMMELTALNQNLKSYSASKNFGTAASIWSFLRFLE